MNKLDPQTAVNRAD